MTGTAACGGGYPADGPAAYPELTLISYLDRATTSIDPAVYSFLARFGQETRHVHSKLLVVDAQHPTSQPTVATGSFNERVWGESPTITAPFAVALGIVLLGQNGLVSWIEQHLYRAWPLEQACPQPLVRAGC